MMNEKQFLIFNEKQFLIFIIKRVLQKEIIQEIPENIDIKKLLTFAKAHALENYLYYGLKDICEEAERNLLKKINQQTIYKIAIQDAECDNIQMEFEKNQINHILLKGSVIKKIYPFADLRTMGDIDILIDETKAKECRQIMQKMGYVCNAFNHSNHDEYTRKPYMVIELHRQLMSDSIGYSKYYQDIWQFVHQIDGYVYQYKMTDEDYYIYMIAHIAKHFFLGGAGIRNIIDIYVYMNAYENSLNWIYISSELEKMELNKFERSLFSLMNYWFRVGNNNEEIELLEEYIMDSTTYGTRKNMAIINMFNGYELNRKLQASKWKYIILSLFPPYKHMTQRNRILKKIPILLPWFWFTRLLKAVFKVKNKKMRMKAVDSITKEDIEKYEKMKGNVSNYED